MALPLDGIIKVFCTHVASNFVQPWQAKAQREGTGSGFVIRVGGDLRVLTNAHVIADAGFILVKRHGSSVKYRASVCATAHECDLAVLQVDDPEFWAGPIQELLFGGVPELQDSVAVAGYPQGGDNISITRGIVSRVEPTLYVHGASHLMAIQVDSAINPGNSGGPALQGDRVVGIAFQNLQSAEAIGYIIPVPVIKRFLADVEEMGGYRGLCSIGISCQSMESLSLREYKGMAVNQTGVLVTRLQPLGGGAKYLKTDDVLLTLDGVPIANDGSVFFRNRERIAFDYLLAFKRVGDTAKVEVLRNGEKLCFDVPLGPVRSLVPMFMYDKRPSYYILAGLVFTALTQSYLHEHGDDWYNASPRKLCMLALHGILEEPDQQPVILATILADDATNGFQGLSDRIIHRVDGVVLQNLRHLMELVESGTAPFVRFDLDEGRVIVLRRIEALDATSRILERHRIAHRCSADLMPRVRH